MKILKVYYSHVLTEARPASVTASKIYMVLYMCFRLLGVESHDFSQAEKERTACKVVQIHKMATIFTQNDKLGPF
jgi:hypothetical protein